MSSNLGDIRRLLPMLDMAYQAEQLKMVKVTTRIRSLQSKLSNLERPKTVEPDTFSAATLAGADLLWEGWAKDRKALINQELAHAFRDRETARVEMVNALSKLEAARQMEARAELDARRAVERRSSW